MEVGLVSDFFVHPVVAGIGLTDTLQLGDTIHTGDVVLVVESMQLSSAEVSEAAAGQPIGMQAIGIKVPDSVRLEDTGYTVI